MGQMYVYNINPFQDTLINIIESDPDFNDIKIKQNIKIVFEYILESIMESKEFSKYLDFDIYNENGFYKVVGNNAISALWLSGIFVDDVDLILKNNTYIIDNKKYRYDIVKKELTYTKLYE